MMTHTVTIKATPFVDERPTLRDVPATIIGPFAIHLTDGSMAYLRPWTVTHVRTGFGVCPLRTEAQAIELANALLHLDWAFDHSNDMPKHTHDETARIIRERQ